jgi:DNA end-binding protein Ku
VINVMDALRRSIAQGQAASARRAKGRKRIDGQAEILLPIAGKAKKAAAAKSTVRPNTHQSKAG